jgi:hypothetical protein
MTGGREVGVFGSHNPDFVEIRHADDRWEDHFEPDEVLQWTGAPSPRLHFKWRYVLAAPTGIAMMIGSIWGPISASSPGARNGDDYYQWLVFAPLMFAIGAFLLALPRVDAWTRAHQKYALTNRRAMIAIDNRFTKVLRAWRIARDQRLKLDDGPLGSVRFATVRAAGVSIPIAFEFIPDAARVYEMLVKIRNNAVRTS